MLFEEKIIVYFENCLIYDKRGTCSDQCPLKGYILFKYMRPVFWT